MPVKKTRTSKTAAKPAGLLERLAAGPVICAEGYLFEFERRGYLQAGAYVPEVVLEHPQLVEGLHRAFVRAGSDVVEAFTYYAHRAKLKIVGREKDLARINRAALAIARKVARSTGTLLAGDICNTSIYGAEDPASHKQARKIFDEQIGWAVDAGVDFIVGETYSFTGEALLALGAIKRSGKPAVITLSVPREGKMRDGETAVAHLALAGDGQRDHGRLAGALDRPQRQQRLAGERVRLAHDEVDAGVHRPADLLVEDLPRLLVRGRILGAVDARVADVAGQQGARAARHLAGDGQRGPVDPRQVLFAADDLQLGPVGVVRERLDDVGAGP